MLNKLFNKLLPCQKIFDQLFEDHEKAKESNRKASAEQASATSRLVAACDVNSQNATVLCFMKHGKNNAT